MRIGLVTDTHIPEVARALPAEVARIFKGVDLILHAGDLYSLAVLDELDHIAPVRCALGDDDDESALSDSRVEPIHNLRLGGKRIWLLHDRSYLVTLSPSEPLNLHRAVFRGAANLTAPDQQRPEDQEKPDIIIFGHEHTVTVRHYNGILWVNSGSPTFLKYRHGLGTVGILEIGSGQPTAEIVQLQRQ